MGAVRPAPAGADIDDADADASVGERARQLAGQLHISAPPLPASYLVGPLIADFRRLHPNIRFELDADARDSPSTKSHDITLLATRGLRPNVWRLRRPWPQAMK